MARELHVLDGLDLADGVVFDILDTPTFTPAPLRLDWVGGVDADGSVPLDAGHSDNCTLTIPLRVIQQTTADLAWTKVGLLLSKLEATRTTRNGLTHLWTPKDSASTWDLTVMSAEIAEMPMASRGDMIGYLLRSPRFTIVLTCKPYLYRHNEVINFTEVQSYTNLITNPNFETNTTGWGTSVSFRNATGGTLTRQTTQFHSGVASMRIVSTAVANQGADYTALPVTAATPITVAMWLRGNAGGESVKIILGDATVGNATSSTLVLTTSWQLLSVTLTPSASGTTGVAIVQTAATIKTWYVDDVIAVYATAAPTYFDGGTSATRNTWTGTANASTSTQDGPVMNITLASVPGHVDAEATVTVTDTDGVPRRHVEWGLGEDSAAPLVIDSASLTLLAGSGNLRTGAYSAAGVVRGTLLTQPQAICGTGNLTHVGVHRPKARIYATSMSIYLRLAYRTADGAYSYTPWIAPVLEDDFCEVAFGVITIGTVQSGAQQWDGRIEAYSTASGDTLDIDYLEILPAERWGKARGAYIYAAGTLLGHDEFAGVAATALHGRVAPAPLGGTWTNSGPNADWVCADAPLATDETIVRTAISDAGVEFGYFGSTDYATIEVGADIYVSIANVFQTTGVMARWSSSTAYVGLNFTAMSSTLANVTLQAVSGGILAGKVAFLTGPSVALWWRLRLVVYASGQAHGFVLNPTTGAVLATLDTAHSGMATGGVLATGKPGIMDQNPAASASSRYFDNFYFATPSVEPIAVNAMRSLLIRHDSCERASSDGLTYGKPGTYTGSRAYVPPAGNANRVTRLWAKARRYDVDVSPDSVITDNVSLDVSLRPRYRLPVAP